MYEVKGGGGGGAPLPGGGGPYPPIACPAGTHIPWGLYPCCQVGGGCPAQPLAALGMILLPHWLAPGGPGVWLLLSRGSARFTSTFLPMMS